MKYTFPLLALMFTLCTCGPAQEGPIKDEPGEQESATSQPNVVFIYLDDLGYGDMSAYGQTTLKTPNMDALANGDVRFTSGYASSATCTPISDSSKEHWRLWTLKKYMLPYLYSNKMVRGHDV